MITIPQDAMIHLDLESFRTPCEIWVNDIPVLRCLTRNAAQDSLCIHAYLQDGLNKVRAVVGPGLLPSRSHSPNPFLSSEHRFVRFQVKAYQVGDETGGDAGQELCRWEWNGKARPVAFPLVEETTFAFDHRFGEFAWHRARQLRLDSSTRAEVERFLRIAHDAWGRGDATAIADFSEPFYQDLARCFPAYGGYDAFRTETIRQFNSAYRFTPWRVEDLSLDDLDLRLCADGKMIDCMNLDWQEAVRSFPDGNGVRKYLPWRLGDVGNGLQILR